MRTQFMFTLICIRSVYTYIDELGRDRMQLILGGAFPDYLDI